MTTHEKLIIIRNVRDAAKYGLSFLISAYTAIKDYNYDWTDEHSNYAKDIKEKLIIEKKEVCYE